MYFTEVTFPLWIPVSPSDECIKLDSVNKSFPKVFSRSWTVKAGTHVNATAYFLKEVYAIDKPGNCFLSDSCQNTYSANCSNLARQERLVNYMLVE